jgi:hypothetical protein
MAASSELSDDSIFGAVPAGHSSLIATVCRAVGAGVAAGVVGRAGASGSSVTGGAFFVGFADLTASSFVDILPLLVSLEKTS